MLARSVTMLVLRHGQSEWNAQRRWQGTIDSPLTSLGREQAATTARLLGALRPRFGVLWSSDLVRASETARIIGNGLELGTPRLDARLREAHAGEWEGLTPDQIESRYPGWLESHRRPATFEHYADVVERATAALQEAAREAASTPSGSALVVAHSGVVRTVIRHLGGLDGRIPNLGGVWLEASIVDGRADLVLGDVFDPSGVVVSGIDAPGEDPGE
jgi:broad specificity phosphatase PhoE